MTLLNKFAGIMMTYQLICIYISLKQKLSIQHLNNVKVNVENMHKLKHIQGWNTSANHPTTLLVERIVKTYDSIEDAENDFNAQASTLEEIGIALKDGSNAVGISPSSSETFDICFTGFPAKDRTELTDLAAKNDMMVRKSVVKNLDILCCGKNAGPKKLESALIQGVTVLNKTQFEHFIETGEITEG